jgi:uncharacterized protein (DUF2141 family)
MESVMPSLKITSLLTSMLLFSSMPASAELSSLKVTVTDAATTAGTIEVTLFDSSESFLKEVFLQQGGKVNENGTFIAEFAGLEEGEYAVVVVHDENDNGAFDSGFLGFGGEGLGYSNNVRSFLGRPDFDDVKLSIGAGSTEIEISID